MSIKKNNMKRYFNCFVVVLLFFTISVKAHQTETSTTMLVENENKTWVVQISAALTAFQQEIKMHYSETPYKTPEEFKEMVLEYVKRNLEIKLNDNERITLSEGMVKLGHETKVVFEVFGVPQDLKSVFIKNETFKDIHRNQSVLVILKEGFDKKQFILKEANNHQLKLETDGIKFKEVEEQQISISSLNIILILAVLLAIGFLFHSIAERKKIRTVN